MITGLGGLERPPLFDRGASVGGLTELLECPFLASLELRRVFPSIFDLEFNALLGPV
jgi:hypothetical protein